MQVLLLGVFTTPTKDARDAVHRLHPKAEVLRISGFQTTGQKAPQSKGQIMQSAANIFRQRDFRIFREVFHNIRNGLQVFGKQGRMAMRYDGYIGKGHEPRPQTINHSAVAGFRRGVGGNSLWRGDGTRMSEIWRAPVTERVLNRLCRLQSQTSSLFSAKHPTPPCWPLSEFWRDRRRAARQDMMIPPAEGDRS